MGIKHKVLKKPGQILYAADWNAQHDNDMRGDPLINLGAPVNPDDAARLIDVLSRIPAVSGGTNNYATPVTTLSTTPVDLTSIDVTTKGGNLLILACVTCSDDTKDTYVYFRLTLDGNPVGPSSAAVFNVEADTSGAEESTALFAWVTGVPAGTHTVALQWYVSAGTGYCSSATIIVIEIPTG